MKNHGCAHLQRCKKQKNVIEQRKQRWAQKKWQMRKALTVLKIWTQLQIICSDSKILNRLIKLIHGFHCNYLKLLSLTCSPHISLASIQPVFAHTLKRRLLLSPENLCCGKDLVSRSRTRWLFFPACVRTQTNSQQHMPGCVRDQTLNLTRRRAAGAHRATLLPPADLHGHIL